LGQSESLGYKNFVYKIICLDRLQIFNYPEGLLDLKIEELSFLYVM